MTKELIAEARAYAGPGNGGWKPFDQAARIRYWRTPGGVASGRRADYEADVQVWEEAHGHDVRLKCFPEFGCRVIESHLEWLIARLVDALEASGAELSAALAVIEMAREWRDPAYEAGWGSRDDYANGYQMALRNVRRILSSVPADALRERDAEKWDEGAQWAAVELGAIDNERQAWITPSDNPYRRTEEENR